MWVSSLSFFGEGGFKRSFVLSRILGLGFVGGGGGFPSVSFQVSTVTCFLLDSG